ncbi:MAG TPA: MaoC/PaaZ C-terminal domain-containing protein [Longimicrobium sp.]|nr:MaoC/PaaZ C-terminal domain-containing protein [Longimicrobium sp.]
MAPRTAPLASMLRLLARGIASRRSAGLPPDVPRRKPAVERVHAGVDPGLHARYLLATAGDAVEALGGNALSPVFPATWETAQALELLASLETPLPAGGVVHVEGELVQLRPLTLGDHVRCRVELERAERVRKGIRLTLSARNWTAGGQLCTQSTAVFLARTRAAAEEPRDAGPPRSTPRDDVDPRAEPPSRWDELAHWSLRGDAGRRYAAVSGDWNPIHLWRLTALPFGFARPILHGFATEAMVAHALIQHRLGGDPAALRRLRIAFRAPLPLPARVRLLVGDGIGVRWFRVAGDGETVYAEGTWAGGTQPPRRLALVK